MTNPDSYDVMPQYQSHKRVRAARLVDWRVPDNPDYEDCMLAVVDVGGQTPKTVRVLQDAAVRIGRMAGGQKAAFADGLKAALGGYLVAYPDGYVSWSPEAPFLDGYTRITEHESPPFADADPL